MTKQWWTGLAFALSLGMLASADTLILQDGSRVDGTFLSATRARINFEAESGGRRWYPVRDVRGIRFGDAGSYGSADRGNGRRDSGDVFADYGRADDRRSRPGQAAANADADAIERKYAEIGGPNGFAGASTMAERQTDDGRGRYREYRGATIYWTPETGAHEVHGSIRDEYKRLGGPTGRLGYPVSDEEAYGRDRVSKFENGAIYWTAQGARVTYTR